MQKTYARYPRGKDSKVNFLLKCSEGTRKVSTSAPENSTLTEFIRKLPGAELKRDENLKANYLAGLDGMEVGEGGIQFYITVDGKKGLPMFVEDNKANEKEVMFPGMDDLLIKGEIDVMIQVDDFKNDPTVPGCKGRMPKQEEKVEFEKCQVYSSQDEEAVIAKQAKTKQYLLTSPSSTSSSDLMRNTEQQPTNKDCISLNSDSNTPISDLIFRNNLDLNFPRGVLVSKSKVCGQVSTETLNPKQYSAIGHTTISQKQQPGIIKHMLRPKFYTQQLKGRPISVLQYIQSNINSSMTKIKSKIRQTATRIVSKLSSLRDKLHIVLSDAVKFAKEKTAGHLYLNVITKMQFKLVAFVSKLLGTTLKVEERKVKGWFRNTALLLRSSTQDFVRLILPRMQNPMGYLYILAGFLVLTTLAFSLFS